MSKNYTMVQYVFPPLTMPYNVDLRKVIYDAAEGYIKAGKLAMGNSAIAYISKADQDAGNKTWFDYRDSHVSNRYYKDENGVWDTVTPWKPDVEQIFYRIFLDANAANEFIQLVLDHGALAARVITEDGAGSQMEYDYPAKVFPPEDHVAQYIWPGHPNFNYQGTYPTVGSPSATPYPSA